MAIKYEMIQPGMTLYQKKRQKAGNTTISYDAVFSVRIVSVDPATRTAVASWNSNPAKKWYERELRKLYANPPKVRPNPFNRPGATITRV